MLDNAFALIVPYNIKHQMFCMTNYTTKQAIISIHSIENYKKLRAEETFIFKFCHWKTRLVIKITINEEIFAFWNLNERCFIISKLFRKS